MNVDDETRDDAATICAIAASGGVVVDAWLNIGDRSTVMGVIGAAMGASPQACQLASAAFEHCYDELGSATDETTLCGEAEALLRTGWSP